MSVVKNTRSFNSARILLTGSIYMSYSSQNLPQRIPNVLFQDFKTWSNPQLL